MVAQDIGAGVPGDAGDTLPATPVDGPGTLPNDTIPTPQPSSAFELSQEPTSPGLTEIDVRDTPIKDSLSLLASTLSTLVTILEDESETSQLTLSSLAYVSGIFDGALRLGRVPWIFDPVAALWRLAAGYTFVLVSVEADYLVCRRVQNGVVVLDSDPTDAIDDSLINVLKNSKLRRTPFDGETVNGRFYEYSSDITRLATIVGSNPVEQEEQVLVPEYIVGDEIVAIRLIDPITIAALPDDPILYIDTNADSRAWSRRDDL